MRHANDDRLLGAVALRSEWAYGAAALFRGGNAADFASALRLANDVVKQLGPNGRLYSSSIW